MFRLQLRGKLVLMMCMVSLVPIFIAGTVVYKATSQSLSDNAINKLEAVRAAKTYELENYFKQIENQIKTFSNDIMIVEAMNQFVEAYNYDVGTYTTDEQVAAYKDKIKSYYESEFSVEYASKTGKSIDIESLLPVDRKAIVSQYNFIANNPHPLGEKSKLDATEEEGFYNFTHAKYHPVIRDYLETYGFYDIFLVEPEKGNIIYSVFKEVDYATSLIDGPYKDSNLASAFTRALEASSAKDVFLEDMKFYTPSYEAPNLFISSPVYDQGKLTGVLVFQLPIVRINDVMHRSEGLGKTGEAYLLADDMYMRSQSVYVDESTMLNVKIDTEGARAAAAGEVYSNTTFNSRGDEVLSTAKSLDIEGLDWLMVSEINKEEALADLQVINTILSVIALIVLVVVCAAAFWFARSVLKQLGADPTQLSEVADDIANGVLDKRIETAKSPVGVFASMLQMRENLNNSIQEDKRKNRRIERVTQALENVQTSVIVTDPQHEIIFCNQATVTMFTKVEAEVRKAISGFSVDKLMDMNIEKFHERTMLDSLSSTNEIVLELGSKTFLVILNPVIGENGERLGTVAEWADRTTELAVEDKVQSLVESAMHGDLTQRISIKTSNGFFKRLNNSINELVDVFERVTNDTVRIFSAISRGDLTESIVADYTGAYGRLKNDANSTIDKLTEIVSKIKESSDLVNTASTEISDGNMNLSHRTESQAASLEVTSSSMEEMTSSVKQNADNSKQASDLAFSAREQASNGVKVVDNAISAMNEIDNASAKIADIITVIDEIAFQTNLLALNASVEAARAGEQGKGFAVVASEVRNLAGRSASAAKEIKELIEDTVSKVEEGGHFVNQSGDVLREIMESVNQVTDIVANISNASQEQAVGIEQVNKTIIDMDSATQQNAALVEEAAAAAESMSEQSEQLANLVEFFELVNNVSNSDDIHQQDTDDEIQTLMAS